MEDVNAPVTISSLRDKVTPFYMNMEVFPGVKRICASPKSAKHTQWAPGADKTALSIKAA